MIPGLWRGFSIRMFDAVHHLQCPLNGIQDKHDCGINNAVSIHLINTSQIQFHILNNAVKT